MARIPSTGDRSSNATADTAISVIRFTFFSHSLIREEVSVIIGSPMMSSSTMFDVMNPSVSGSMYTGMSRGNTLLSPLMTD